MSIVIQNNATDPEMYDKDKEESEIQRSRSRVICQ